MAVSIPLAVLELACSRICHDLISPVGAINNGIELSQELDGDMADEAMELVADSGRRAAAKLQTFRLALGAAGGQSKVGPREVRATMSAYLEGGKITLDWPPDATEGLTELPAGAGRLMTLAILLAEEGLVQGGRIVPAFDRALGEVRFEAIGRKAGLSADSLAALAGECDAADLSPRTVTAFLAGRFARAANLPLSAGATAALGDQDEVFTLLIGLGND